MKNPTNQRWIKETPRIPSTRRGLAPITPAYVPARVKPASRR